MISCRIRPKKFFLVVFLVEFQLYFTGFLKVYVTLLLLKTYLTSKIEKNIQHVFFLFFFLQFYELPDCRKKIFTTWNVLKSEVYLTCINLLKLHDNLKVCLQVIRLLTWTKNVKFSVKMQFLHIWPPEKSVFELMTKLKFSFSQTEPGSVHIPPKPIFLFKFSNF